MFDDSLIESSGRIKTKKGTTVAISVVVHIVILVVFIIVPLMMVTDALPTQQLMRMLVAPPPPPPPPPPLSPAAVQPMVIKLVQVDPGTMVARTTIPKEIALVVEEAAPSTLGVPGGTGRGDILVGVLGNVLKTQREPTAPPLPPPPLPPPPPPRQRIGGSVAQANLIKPAAQPIYPPLARQARVSGTVILEATISKEGTIEDLKVINGHPLLTQAAMDAVRRWRYKPTMLNGEPIEVTTTITVNFSLGS